MHPAFFPDLLARQLILLHCMVPSCSCAIYAIMVPIAIPVLHEVATITRCWAARSFPSGGRWWLWNMCLRCITGCLLLVPLRHWWLPVGPRYHSDCIRVRTGCIHWTCRCCRRCLATIYTVTEETFHLASTALSCTPDHGTRRNGTCRGFINMHFLSQGIIRCNFSCLCSQATTSPLQVALITW